MLSQILEHVQDVQNWIQKAHTLLSNDGLIVVALPNFDNLTRMILQEKEPYICPPAHLNYFNKTSLVKLLESNGFQIEKVEFDSRIPLSSIEKRMILKKNTVPIFNIAVKIILKIMNLTGRGIMLNVYARKVS